MKISLNEAELHQAVVEFIDNKGIDLSTKKVTIELTAGRKPNGFYADVEIEDKDSESEDKTPFAADDNIGTEEDQSALDI